MGWGVLRFQANRAAGLLLWVVVSAVSGGLLGELVQAITHQSRGESRRAEGLGADGVLLESGRIVGLRVKRGVAGSNEGESAVSQVLSAGAQLAGSA